MDKMNWTHWITTVIAGVAAVGPQLIPIIPAPWANVATGVIGFLGAVYHLMQEAPH